jgi:phosphinothricin acetyltransferase
MADLSVRDATADDAEAITRIYNQGIEDRVATFETLLRTPDERSQWLAAHGPRHPVLVAVNNKSGDVVGWASLNQFNPRAAYDNVADFSIYVERDSRGTGVGTLLLEALEDRARGIGYHKLVLGAFPSNEPGMRLYTRRGFTLVGTFHEQGLLDGTWMDVVYMEKIFQ